MAKRTASRLDRMRRSRATGDLADDMTHAALTPLLGREFDNFLFASIDDDRNGPLLSVVSALARLRRPLLCRFLDAGMTRGAWR